MRRGLLIVAAAGLLVAAIAVQPNGTLRPHGASFTPAAAARLRASTKLTAHLPHVVLAVAADNPIPRVVLGATVSRPVVALTFDLDMTPSMEADVNAGTSWFDSDALSYLRTQHVHATMFMTGMWAETYPSIARQIAGDPNFEIGNHSYSHPAFHLPCYQLGSVSRSAQAQQIQMAQRAIVWVTGITPRYFRFPGGCYDRRALDLVHAARLIPIEWTVNSIDAFNPYPAQIAWTVLSQVKPGSIVIMHLQGGANAPATGQALRLIVPALEQRGYQFVTVGELLAVGTPIQPTDPREVVEAAAPTTPSATLAEAGRVLLVKPTTRWCGWVTRGTTRSWVCT
ncbi:MAG: polysaccharide deacetylase [Chloroflexi bacterium]|nr:MAG: polysaccharide deacetylase [Chloroflexota bacterium]TME46248.1 MAG: polysaccharide deacetylase [Chloroflexota bacterium]